MDIKTDDAQGRPWYREPWPWVLIALPLLTVIASAFTFWLAVSHPDFLVIDTPEYRQIKSDLRAEPSAGPVPATKETDGER